MANKVERTPRSASDLDEIWLSIAVESERAAQQTIDRIVAAAHRLGAFPALGRQRPELGEGTRSWAVGAYVILYTASGTSTVILRVVHGARDLGDLRSDL